MNIKKDLCKDIFREYDIRGNFPNQIDEDTAYTIGLAFGTKMKELGHNNCVVGHDNRLSKEILTNALLKGITETGVDVIFLGLCTTPMYYYACIKLNTPRGVMITASHNPKDDNGFKFAYDETGNCRGKTIQEFLKLAKSGEFSSGNGNITTYDIKDEYKELMRKSLDFGNRKVKVVIDPANGTTSIIAKEIYELFPIDLITINNESDATFPNHHPDPSIETNMKQLKKAVIENNADLGIGFDGDGDRVGFVSKQGNYIHADLFMIIVIRDIINKVNKKEFLYDVKCTKSLEDEIIKLGGKPICSRTGNSYTKGTVIEQNLPFGGEGSGHIYFNDKFPGFDSGIYAGLRMVEILSKTNKNMEELLEGINKYYSSIEMIVKTKEDIKFEVVNKVLEYVKEKGYNHITIDGVKVLFKDGWALVRASNTGPNLTIRYEANTEERLKEIEEEFNFLVEKYNK